MSPKPTHTDIQAVRSAVAKMPVFFDFRDLLAAMPDAQPRPYVAAILKASLLAAPEGGAMRWRRTPVRIWALNAHGERGQCVYDRYHAQKRDPRWVQIAALSPSGYCLEDC